MMHDRYRINRILLVLYALASIVIAVPLVFTDEAGDLGRTTSGRILAAALIALAFGALGATRDPWANRLVIKMLIAFTGMATVVIAVRIAFHHHESDPGWFLLPPAAVACVLLTLFFPRPPR